MHDIDTRESVMIILQHTLAFNKKIFFYKYERRKIHFHNFRRKKIYCVASAFYQNIFMWIFVYNCCKKQNILFLFVLICCIKYFVAVFFFFLYCKKSMCV